MMRMKIMKTNRGSRLCWPDFDREDELQQESPRRIIFLSVEGDDTERTYFQHLEEHLDNTIIHIEVLRHRHGDGYSDPKYVIELLEECVRIRNGELIPKEIQDLISPEFSEEFINAYIQDSQSLDKILVQKFKEKLLQISIQLDYHKYLQDLNPEEDIFAIVLDRDRGNHSRELMEECVRFCESKGYSCFVSNPCFEFWLLLHLCDVQNFTVAQQEKILWNNKISHKHTFVSEEVTKRAHHSKVISTRKFDEIYWPNITKAIQRAQYFATDFPELLDGIGTNIFRLLEEIHDPAIRI